MNRFSGLSEEEWEDLATRPENSPPYTIKEKIFIYIGLPILVIIAWGIAVYFILKGFNII